MNEKKFKEINWMMIVMWPEKNDQQTGESLNFSLFVDDFGVFLESFFENFKKISPNNYLTKREKQNQT